jgi:hypothetical protein
MGLGAGWWRDDVAITLQIDGAEVRRLVEVSHEQTIV